MMLFMIQLIETSFDGLFFSFYFGPPNNPALQENVLLAAADLLVPRPNWRQALARWVMGDGLLVMTSG